MDPTTQLITTIGSICVVAVGIAAVAGLFIGLRAFGKHREKDIATDRIVVHVGGSPD